MDANLHLQAWLKQMMQPLQANQSDLALFELLGVLDDLLQLAVHQLLLEGRQLSLLLLILLACQLPVRQQLHRHAVLVGQQVLLNQGPKDILP